MVRTNRFWISFASLNALSLAFGTLAVAGVTRDLKPEELSKAFKDFSVKIEDGQYAQLRGTIPAQCAAKFGFEQVQTKTAKNGEYVGFRVIDKEGDGLACVEKARTDCSSGTMACSYTQLSTIANARMALPEAGTALVGLQTLDASRGDDVKDFADFPSGKLDYVSPSETVARAHKKEIEDKKKQVNCTDCRSDFEGIQAAREAAQWLDSNQALDGALKDYLKKLETAALNVYKSKAEKLPTSELAALREQLLSDENLVDAKPSDKAKILDLIAKRYMNDSELGLEDKTKLAHETISEAEGLALSAADKKSFADKHLEIDSEKAHLMIEQGLYGNENLVAFYSKPGMFKKSPYEEYVKRLSKSYKDSKCAQQMIPSGTCKLIQTSLTENMQAAQLLQMGAFYNPAYSPEYQAQMMAQQRNSAMPYVPTSATGAAPQMTPGTFTVPGAMNQSYGPMWSGGNYGATPGIQSNFGI